MSEERSFELSPQSYPPEHPPQLPAPGEVHGAGRERGEAELEPGAGDLEAPADAEPRTTWPGKRATSRTRRRVPASEPSPPAPTAEQRMLLLDTWLRSKLSAREFAAMVGVSAQSLYTWKRRFEEDGPAGLAPRKRGAPRGSRLSEATRRAILLLKRTHPDWGQDRIRDVLMRTEGFGASAGAIGRVLEEEGYTVEDVPTRPHPPKVQRFERSRPNELWQTDLFTFTLKREGRRVHLVCFLDDFSRFIVGFGLHASASGALVREVFEAAIANWGAPSEVLTDNGTQYHTWRGKSEFRKLCDRRGIRQVVASPRRPQTLGKIERFWGSFWRECAEAAIFRGLDDARRRIALYVDHYNFQRPHQGIDGLVPADRFFEAAPQVLATLRARVDANALELARHGEPRKPFYLTGRVGEELISLHAEGERVVMTHGDGEREEVDLGAPGQRAREGDGSGLPEPVSSSGVPSGTASVVPSAAPPDHPATVEQDEPPPGTSPLDGLLDRLEASLKRDDASEQGARVDDATSTEGGAS